jgi:hypothetical protein
MTWITTNIRWIMVVSGVLTMAMLYAVIAPTAALTSTFGDTLLGPLAEIVVRNWGAQIVLVAAMLLYGAYHPAVRPLVLTVAGLGKAIFIGLVLAYGRQYLAGQAGLVIAIDLVMVVLFAGCLVSVRRGGAGNQVH